MQTTTDVKKKKSRFSLPLALFVVAALVLIVVATSVPNLLRSRIAANEASAVGSLRTLNTALVTYSAQHPGQGYPRDLSELAPLVDANLASGQKSGYAFRYEPQAPDPDGVVKGFRVQATPLATGHTGTRRFSSHESGAISYQIGAAQQQRLDDGSPQQPESWPAESLRRTIHKGLLTLIVADPAPVADQVRALAYRLGGYVDSARASEDGASVKQVSITIRVPSSRFDEARLRVRALGERVRKEEDDARDVTGQYVDLESHLRNFHAEEAQYLEIMRRSGSIKDTLAVAERLADVRGRIERTQGQLNLLAHQTEMAVLEITLCTEAVAQPVDVRWHPRAEVKAAFWAAADDLSTYANFMIAAVFRLPVFVLWTVTFLVPAFFALRLLRWTWKRFVLPSTPTANPAA